jgi:hypothetical protein
VRHHYVGEKVWCVSPVTGATEGEEAVVGGHEDDGETGATEEEAVVGGHEDYGKTRATEEGKEAAEGGHEGDGKTELPSCKIWRVKYGM